MSSTRPGGGLTAVCRELQRSLGVAAAILPMSDDPVRTEVRTDDGWLEFQDYFVGRHQEPEVHDVRFRGAELATAAPGVVDAIDAAATIVIAPSNPIVSVAPILGVAEIRGALDRARGRGTRIVAVSGIVGGKALKGPADRMLTSLGHESSALGVARIYASLATDFVVDTVDAAAAPAIEALGLRAHVTDTIRAAATAGTILRTRIDLPRMVLPAGNLAQNGSAVLRIAEPSMTRKAWTGVRACP